MPLNRTIVKRLYPYYGSADNVNPSIVAYEHGGHSISIFATTGFKKKKSRFMCFIQILWNIVIDHFCLVKWADRRTTDVAFVLLSEGPTGHKKKIAPPSYYRYIVYTKSSPTNTIRLFTATIYLKNFYHFVSVTFLMPT